MATRRIRPSTVSLRLRARRRFRSSSSWRPRPRGRPGSDRDLSVAPIRRPGSTRKTTTCPRMWSASSFAPSRSSPSGGCRGHRKPKSAPESDRSPNRSSVALREHSDRAADRQSSWSAPDRVPPWRSRGRSRNRSDPRIAVCPSAGPAAGRRRTATARKWSRSVRFQLNASRSRSRERRRVATALRKNRNPRGRGQPRLPRPRAPADLPPRHHARRDPRAGTQTRSSTTTGMVRVVAFSYSAKFGINAAWAR